MVYDTQAKMLQQLQQLPGHRVRRTSSMAWWLVGLEDESLRSKGALVSHSFAHSINTRPGTFLNSPVHGYRFANSIF